MKHSLLNLYLQILLVMVKKKKKKIYEYHAFEASYDFAKKIQLDSK